MERGAQEAYDSVRPTDAAVSGQFSLLQIFLFTTFLAVIISCLRGISMGMPWALLWVMGAVTATGGLLGTTCSNQALAGIKIGGFCALFVPLLYVLWRMDNWYLNVHVGACVVALAIGGFWGHVRGDLQRGLVSGFIAFLLFACCMYAERSSRSESLLVCVVSGTISLGAFIGTFYGSATKGALGALGVCVVILLLVLLVAALRPGIAVPLVSSCIIGAAWGTKQGSTAAGLGYGLLGFALGFLAFVLSFPSW